MTNSLITVGATRMDGNPERGEARAINTINDVRAGQYWRTKAEVEPLVEYYDQEITEYYKPEDPEYDHTLSWQSQPKPDKKIEKRSRQKRRGFPAGYLLLIAQVHYASGFLHSVTTGPHPLDDNKEGHTFLLDEILEQFEHVSDADAQAQRGRELQGLQDDLGNLQRELLAGPPSVQPAALIGKGPAALPSEVPTLTTLVKHSDQIQDLTERTNVALAMAEETQSHIAEKSKAIASITTTMARFYTERSTAMIALTQDVVAHAKNLQLGAEAIGLYAGTGVEVTTVVEGKSAPASEKLTVLRDCLYMDEEYLVHLNGEEDNGADFQSVPEFIKALAEDEALRNACLPRQRMIALMRPRRLFKDYGTPLASLSLNKLNQESFLIVRDGENFHIVEADFLKQRAKLFPTVNSLEGAFFKGTDGSALTADDLMLGKKSEDANAHLKVYKTLLLLLWGLNDRLGLFGTFYTDYPEDGFLNPIFQERNIDFITGEENLLGRGYPRWDDYQAEQNAKLRSGSRVLVRLQGLGKGGIPFLESTHVFEINDDQPDALYWSAKEKTVIGVARRKGNQFFIEIQLRNVIRHRNNLLNTKVYLDPTSSAILVLDSVKAEDVDYYIGSRADRSSYGRFMHMMFMARAYLTQEEEVIAPIAAKIEAALTDEHAPAPFREKPLAEVREVIDETIRTYRAARRGEMIGDADYGSLLKQAQVMLTQNDYSGAVETFCERLGVKPIRLVQTGRDKFALYTFSRDEEKEELIYAHRWISRRKLIKTADGFKSDGYRLVMYNPNITDEITLHSWPEAEAEAALLKEPGSLKLHDRYDDEAPVTIGDQIPLSTHTKLRALFEDSSALEFLAQSPFDFEDSLKQLNRARQRAKGNMVRSMMVAAPVGITRQDVFARAGVNEWKIEPAKVTVAVLYMDAYEWHYFHAKNDQERKEAIDAYCSYFNDKTYARNRFLKAVGADQPQDGDDQMKRKPESHAIRLTNVSIASALTTEYGKFTTCDFWHGVPLRANWLELDRYRRAILLPAKRDNNTDHHSHERNRRKNAVEADFHFPADAGYALLPFPEKVDAVAKVLGDVEKTPELPKEK